MKQTSYLSSTQHKVPVRKLLRTIKNNQFLDYFFITFAISAESKKKRRERQRSRDSIDCCGGDTGRRDCDAGLFDNISDCNCQFIACCCCCSGSDAECCDGDTGCCDGDTECCDGDADFDCDCS